MRPVDGVDLISIRIDEKLAGLTPNDSEYSCIFRVHNQLRKTNEKAYEPQLLAIGPYHRGKDDLRLMEDHKLRYLQLILQRGNESSVERYIKAMRELEGRAREFYSEPISLTTDDFIEMLLLDGCFIIELFRKLAVTDLREEFDPIFQVGWIFCTLKRDLLLLENQLPFFILTKLFEMTKVPNLHKEIIDLALHFFTSLPSLEYSYESGDVSIRNNKHLLGLIHKFIRPIGNVVLDQKDQKSTRGATELEEAGVKFKKVEGVNLFDIKFNNGVLEIPLLQIEDRSESLFRNLIAYEQYSRNYHLQYVTDYVSFMGYLIHSPKDVELLRRRGIIVNWLGDDEAVSTMFNKIGDCVVVYDLCYAEILSNLDKHCRRRQNVWMAKLRHNYFNSPWAWISFLAAAVLLLVALTQTIFSILSYFGSQKVTST
ncbi:UPF0481 protein At3g47200-like [Corylus avellana]|uniref:UPF0481 protein At3g47200-like n=1 Tax=Corylus avellana TaxID=13451 RepID=UPI001E1F36F8|nr:UPF0481 protein At3g47200-like [Corylus avellana]